MDKDPNLSTLAGEAGVNPTEDRSPTVNSTLPHTLKPAVAPRFSAQQTFAALRYPNYRLWFMGQLASLVGTWMQSTAQGYLVFQLTQSAAFLGYVGFAAGIPSWLFMLYGGVISDRLSRRTLLVITQALMMVLAFILAGLTFAHLIQPWHIIVLAFLLGTVNAFDAPARQAFTLEMVSREDLGNAIALNSAMFNSATAVGPAIAGLAYAVAGPAWCFTINGLSFIAVIIALLKMRFTKVVITPRRGSALADLGEGLRYVLSHSVIRTLVVIVAIATLFGMAFATLIPEWAVDILHGDATTNGLLQSARGVGSVIGALMIASLGNFSFKGKLLSIGLVVFPVMLIVFSMVRSAPLAFPVLVGASWGSMVLYNLCNNLVQSHVADELRGRVMGLYSLTFLGVIPIASLLSGLLADRIGSPQTVRLTAAILLVFSLALWIGNKKIRTL